MDRRRSSYGANAIGGLVNVISNQIPTQPITRTLGNTQVDLATNGGEAAVAGDLTVGNGNWAIEPRRIGAPVGDYETPEGTVENTQSRGAFASVGVSRTSQNAYLGAGVQIDDTKYGVPVIEGGAITLTPRRQVYGVRGEARNLSGVFSSARGSLAYHRYRHEELVGDVVGTEFRNDLIDVDVRATHQRDRQDDRHASACRATRARSIRSARKRFRRRWSRTSIRPSATRR